MHICLTFGSYLKKNEISHLSEIKSHLIGLHLNRIFVDWKLVIWRLPTFFKGHGKYKNMNIQIMRKLSIFILQSSIASSSFKQDPFLRAGSQLDMSQVMPGGERSAPQYKFLWSPSALLVAKCLLGCGFLLSHEACNIQFTTRGFSYQEPVLETPGYSHWKQAQLHLILFHSTPQSEDLNRPPRQGQSQTPQKSFSPNFLDFVTICLLPQKTQKQLNLMKFLFDFSVYLETFLCMFVIHGQ